MKAATTSRRGTVRLLLRLLVASMRARPRPTARLAFWSLAEAVPTIVFGQAVARAVDAFRADRPVDAACWLAALAAAAVAGAVGAQRLYRPLAQIVEPFRDELVRAVAGAGLRRSVRGGPDAGAVARLTHQVEIVRDTFGGILIVLRGFLFATAGALAGMLTLMPEVVLLVVPPLAVGLGLFTAVFGAAAVRQRRLIVGEERIAERTTALAEGLRDVVACGGEGGLRDGLGAEVDAQAAAARAVARMAAVRALALAIGGWGPALLILGAAPWLVSRGATAGTLIGALTYVLHGLHPALESMVRGMGGSGLRLAVTLGRILETSAPERDPDDAAPPLEAAPGDSVLRPAVELNAVTFAYGPAAEPVIRDLDLTIPPGEHLAVVGPSGIGKSTLAALIAGLLDPRSGRIRVDGRPAGDARARVLIPQEAYVFDGTLRDNLTYLAPDAAPAAIARAVIAVGLEELTHRAGGLATRLDPAALSAGERQLIALGRAYLAPAPLVILDEAGCHLDPAAEDAAEEAFARRPGGTLIVIAHRMSSALRARRILVLDGSSADLGEHEELLGRSPLYRDLLGHWTAGSEPGPGSAASEPGPGSAGSEPALLLGDPDGLHPVARPDLAVDAGQVVADGPDLQHEVGGYLRRGGPAGG
ncbi:ATP-binding cassette domain-containing protein [Actinomadura sp. 1N219]|uniref:ATP-binding cassette domain-containing protein n=1 Tax=Actinomadura sp. 1N219 TaxID=3375152 RepID=UPI0037BCF57F